MKVTQLFHLETFSNVKIVVLFQQLAMLFQTEIWPVVRFSKW